MFMGYEIKVEIINYSHVRNDEVEMLSKHLSFQSQ